MINDDGTAHIKQQKLSCLADSLALLMVQGPQAAPDSWPLLPPLLTIQPVPVVLQVLRAHLTNVKAPSQLTWEAWSCILAQHAAEQNRLES